jgi:hypothetical protein
MTNPEPIDSDPKAAVTKSVGTEPGKTETSDGHPTDIFNNLADLRKQSKLTVQRKRLLINVSIDRPANDVYFRVHPDPEMRLDEHGAPRIQW